MISERLENIFFGRLEAHQNSEDPKPAKHIQNRHVIIQADALGVRYNFYSNEDTRYGWTDAKLDQAKFSDFFVHDLGKKGSNQVIFEQAEKFWKEFDGGMLKKKAKSIVIAVDDLPFEFIEPSDSVSKETDTYQQCREVAGYRWGEDPVLLCTAFIPRRTDDASKGGQWSMAAAMHIRHICNLLPNPSMREIAVDAVLSMPLLILEHLIEQARLRQKVEAVFFLGVSQSYFLYVDPTNEIIFADRVSFCLLSLLAVIKQGLPISNEATVLDVLSRVKSALQAEDTDKTYKKAKPELLNEFKSFGRELSDILCHLQFDRRTGPLDSMQLMGYWQEFPEIKDTFYQESVLPLLEAAHKKILAGNPQATSQTLPFPQKSMPGMTTEAILELIVQRVRNYEHGTDPSNLILGASEEVNQIDDQAFRINKGTIYNRKKRSLSPNSIIIKFWKSQPDEKNKENDTSSADKESTLPQGGAYKILQEYEKVIPLSMMLLSVVICYIIFLSFNTKNSSTYLSDISQWSKLLTEMNGKEAKLTQLHGWDQYESSDRLSWSQRLNRLALSVSPAIKLNYVSTVHEKEEKTGGTLRKWVIRGFANTSDPEHMKALNLLITHLNGKNSPLALDGEEVSLKGMESGFEPHVNSRVIYFTLEARTKVSVAKSTMGQSK
ncbi:hypothetical protein SIID45300_03262 [Candidatus Magnetaquicoccaceae bacterium FCR-1]|uniref:Uncharacterized protein n=1 Tax=Candidatus Magnetaquiglobus chichijimensis TaxID=3141448 RepID=A0ABQ0CDC9_9PROT